MKNKSKKSFLVLVLCTLFFPLYAQSFVQVIPQPQQTEILAGTFSVGQGTKIICSEELNDIVSIFNERLSEVREITFPVQTRGESKGNISLKINPQLKEKEGYWLAVTPSEILIEAANSGGIFYGLQTLLQMILNAEDAKIPCCRITDWPRFAWRGVMLDVSRTFMPLTMVKQYIDLFAEMKLNVLHLHLTDDQGWRVEIKQYPRLTKVGSKFDPEFNSMGGYYTQDDIRDLVRYAGLRNITIVPEIDMPGHVCAALAAYPHLSCFDERPVVHTFREGPSIHEEIFCAGKETTYQFVFNVLDELISLFPSPYIHIGGDEARKPRWKKCPHCQKAIVDLGLKDEEELQSHFVKRVGEHIRKKGRTLVGWDEIMDGGKLDGSEVVMYWRNEGKENIGKTVQSGYKAVCTFGSHFYFIDNYRRITTRRVYDYEPGPEINFPEQYLGIQASFWSHIARSEYNIDKEIFPRVLGLAENAWTLPNRKDWNRFRDVARKNADRLKTIDCINVFNDTSLDAE